MMSKKKKIILVAVLIGCLLGVGFFASKYVQRGKNGENDSSADRNIAVGKDVARSDRDVVAMKTDDDNKVGSAGDSPGSTRVVDDESVDFKEDTYLDMSADDCGNNCLEFDEPDDLKYCKEYCGTEEATLMTENCDELEDLEQDYCYKHQARSKKDALFCKLIVDENIKQACDKQGI